jgi:hypothetical protein
MPIPVTARQGPTMVQQLDEILSAAHRVPVGDIDQPPNVDPFVYRPVERGRRARSESPGSFSLPLRPATFPLTVPQATYSNERPSRPLGHPRGRRETTSEEDVRPTLNIPQQPPIRTQAPQEPQINRMAQQPLAQEPRRSFPTPRPVIVSPYPIYHYTSTPSISDLQTWVCTMILSNTGFVLGHSFKRSRFVVSSRSRNR